MGVVVGFYCGVVRCELARRGDRRGAASGGVQRECAWYRSRSDLDPQSRAIPQFAIREGNYRSA